eukprot:TRINITY_DN329_c0_g1_i10.p1 TRINITY_DN329_c0_g1~~TRINITY_DN329_c0_g1_i10.p1  ORF type:complete len:201 (+),score=117.17 TRINITY_DN329_c0_g1_i10:326-928(+)
MSILSTRKSSFFFFFFFFFFFSLFFYLPLGVSFFPIMSGHVDLREAIEMSNGVVLNAKNDGPGFAALFDGSNATSIVSDADEQLLVTVPFRQNVKVHSLRVLSSGDDKDACPRTLRLFVNRTAMDFGDAEGDPPTQELEITQDQAANGAVVPLKFTKFQSVHSLTIFISDNHGAEETVLTQIGLIGVQLGEQFGKLEKVG